MIAYIFPEEVPAELLSRVFSLYLVSDQAGQEAYLYSMYSRLRLANDDVAVGQFRQLVRGWLEKELAPGRCAVLESLVEEMAEGTHHKDQVRTISLRNSSTWPPRLPSCL